MDCYEVCWLIKNGSTERLKKYLQNFTYSIEFIKKLLLIYHNKTPLSVTTLQDLIEENGVKINNEKHGRQDYPLLCAIKMNDIEKVQFLIEYATENNIKLRINDKQYKDNFPLLQAIKNKNISIIKLLMEYADKNGIVLNLNDKCQSNHSYPLLWAIEKNDSDIVKLLINYADKNKIILNITSKNKKGISPIYMAVMKENFEIVKLLLNYSKRNYTSLLNYENHYFEVPFMKNVKHNKTDIVRLLLDYAENTHYPLSFGIQSPLNNYHYSPITYASNHRFSYMATLLKNYFSKYFFYSLDYRNICIDTDWLCYLYPGC